MMLTRTALILSLLSGSMMGCALEDASSLEDSEDLGEAVAALTTSRLPARSCGTWNNRGVHTTGEYFVGHSNERRDETSAYFVFDLTPVKGKTVRSANVTIPGTPDWAVTVAWENHTPLFQFKLGMTPLPAGVTLARVTGGSNDPALFHSVAREQNLGYEWFPSASTTNTYDAFHYNPARFQQAVNAGGLYPMFAVNRFGQSAATEEYVYADSRCTSAVTLNITVE